jgi:hypothetical protein
VRRVNVAVVLFAVVIAIAAAARSTWSPCGQSMLSQITPVGEAGRNQRYARTVGWFIIGAVAGGLTLGGAAAALAALVAALDLGHHSALAISAAAAFAAAVVDTRVLGFGPPFIRRQVNEDWLSRYRPWVYGGGFGWQIGTGLVTYVMTAAVPLVIVLAALTARPWAALCLGVVFGLTRGLAVLLSAPLRSQSDLYAFHRRFTRAGEPVRIAVIGVQLAVATIGAWITAPPFVAMSLTAAVVALVVWMQAQRSRNRQRADVPATATR